MPVKSSQFAPFTPQDILDGKISEQEYESNIKTYFREYLDHFGLELKDERGQKFSADELAYFDLDSFREILRQNTDANLGVNPYGEQLVTRSSAPGLFGASGSYTTRLRPADPSPAAAIATLQDSFDSFYTEALGFINHRLLRDARLDDATLPASLPRFVMELFEIYVQDRVLLGDKSTGAKSSRTSSISYQRPGEIPVSAALAEYCGVRDGSRLSRMTAEILKRFDACFDATRMPDGHFVSKTESDFSGLITQLKGNPDLKIDLYRPLGTITDGVKIFVRSLVAQSPNLMQELADIDRQEGISKEILRQKELITDELQKIESVATAQELYRRLIRPFEGDQASRAFLYGKLGIAENDLNTVHGELDFLFGAESVLRNSADEIRDKLKPLREKNFKHLGEKRWQFLTDLAIAKKQESAKQGGKQIMLIGGSIAAGIVAGALSGGNPVIGAAAGMAVAAFMGGVDVRDVQKRLETLRGANTAHRLAGFKLGTDESLRLVEQERDYAISSALCNTLLAGVSGGASAAVGKRLSGQAIRLALAKRVAAEAGIGANDGLISALADGRITDVAFLENTTRLSTGSADEAPSVVEGIVFSMTVSALFGVGTEAGMAGIGKAFRCLRDHLGRPRWLRADGKEITPELKITGCVNENTRHVEYEWSDGKPVTREELATLNRMSSAIPTITRDLASAQKSALELTRLSGREHTVFQNSRGDYFIQEGSAREAWSDALDSEWDEASRDAHREFFGWPVAHTHPPESGSLPSYADLLQFAASAKLTLKDGENFTTQILTPRESGDITVTLLVGKENGHVWITVPKEQNSDLGQPNEQTINTIARSVEHKIHQEKDEAVLKNLASGKLQMGDTLADLIFNAAEIAEQKSLGNSHAVLDLCENEQLARENIATIFDLVFGKKYGFNDFEVRFLLKHCATEDLISFYSNLKSKDVKSVRNAVMANYFSAGPIASKKDYFSQAVQDRIGKSTEPIDNINWDSLTMDQLDMILDRLSSESSPRQTVEFLQRISAKKIDPRVRDLVLNPNPPSSTGPFLEKLGANEKNLVCGKDLRENEAMLKRTRAGIQTLIAKFVSSQHDLNDLQGRIYVAEFLMGLFNPSYDKGIVREVRDPRGTASYKPMKLVVVKDLPTEQQGTPGLHQEFQALVPEIINNWKQLVSFNATSLFNPDLTTATTIIEAKVRFHLLESQEERDEIFRQLPQYLEKTLQENHPCDIKFIIMTKNPVASRRTLEQDREGLMKRLKILSQQLDVFLRPESRDTTDLQNRKKILIREWLSKIKIDFRAIDAPQTNVSTLSLREWLNRNVFSLMQLPEYADLLRSLGLEQGVPLSQGAKKPEASG